MAFLTETELKQIEDHVAKAETGTSGEIVVSVVPGSGGYSWIVWSFAAVGVFIPSAVLGVVSLFDWPFSALQLLEWQIVGACVGLAASLSPGLRRLVVSKKVRAHKSHQKALATFVIAGVAQTRDRTGILIFISEFEHRVEIIADRGIHEKLGETYWKSQVTHIVDGIKKRQTAQAICEAVDQIGSKLSEHFPRKADDTNELPNKPH